MELDLGHIIKVKTGTELREDKDKDGFAVARLISKITLETDAEPIEMLHLLRVMRSQAPMELIITTPQSEMDLDITETRAKKQREDR